MNDELTSVLVWNRCPVNRLMNGQWVDEWTSLLIWNWYHAKGRLIELVIIEQDWCAGRWETIEIDDE